MVSVVPAHRAGQILKIGQLAAAGGCGEVRRKLRKLGGLSRVAARRCGLSGGLQIGGNLLRNLFVFSGIRLLKLLERSRKLGERRQLAAVRWRRNRGGADRGQIAGACAVLSLANAENRL